MDTMASQITSLAIVYLISYSGADQRKHQSSVSLAFVRGIHRWPVNSPHKKPVTRKMFPFDDVIVFRPDMQIGGMFLICQNATMWVYGAWTRIYRVLCSNYMATLVISCNSTLVWNKPLGAPAFVWPAYWFTSLSHGKYGSNFLSMTSIHVTLLLGE